MADETITAKEIILYDDGKNPVFPRTVLSSITTDNGAKSLAKYIEDLIATAKREAIQEATTLANNAQSAAEAKAAELASAAQSAAEAKATELANNAQSTAIQEATELANNAQTNAVTQVQTDLGYTSTNDKVTFSKAITSDSVEGAVWN